MPLWKAVYKDLQRALRARKPSSKKARSTPCGARGLGVAAHALLQLHGRGEAVLRVLEVLHQRVPARAGSASSWDGS